VTSVLSSANISLIEIYNLNGFTSPTFPLTPYIMSNSKLSNATILETTSTSSSATVITDNLLSTAEMMKSTAKGQVSSLSSFYSFESESSSKTTTLKLAIPSSSASLQTVTSLNITKIIDGSTSSSTVTDTVTSPNIIGKVNTSADNTLMMVSYLTNSTRAIFASFTASHPELISIGPDATAITTFGTTSSEPFGIVEVSGTTPSDSSITSREELPTGSKIENININVQFPITTTTMSEQLSSKTLSYTQTEQPDLPSSSTVFSFTEDQTTSLTEPRHSYPQTATRLEDISLVSEVINGAHSAEQVSVSTNQGTILSTETVRKASSSKVTDTSGLLHSTFTEETVYSGPTYNPSLAPSNIKYWVSTTTTVMNTIQPAAILSTTLRSTSSKLSEETSTELFKPNQSPSGTYYQPTIPSNTCLCANNGPSYTVIYGIQSASGCVCPQEEDLAGNQPEKLIRPLEKVN
jgi:hypothetical protein